MIWSGSIPQLVSSSRWPSHETTLFQSIEELRFADQRQCSICRCISKCLNTNELKQLSGGPYKTSLILTPSTGRPCLRVRLIDHSNAITPEEIFAENIALYYPSIVKSPLLSATLDHCSRLENDSTGSLASFEIAKFWLNECLDKHYDCPKPASDWLPTRLLDVKPVDRSQGIRLVETAETLSMLQSSEKRYISLSHCWGKEQIITTTSATLEDRKTKISMADLSQTFRDAVVITRKLGQRFLWIDSLCIVQDSAEDWKKESVQMCAVYQRAVVTIAAVHASSGNQGCFALRDGLALMPFSVPFRTLQGSGAGSVFFLPLSVPAFDLNIKDEQPLFTRAWVLQEQVLSRALLMYQREELLWECHTVQKSERSPDGAAIMRGHEDLSRALVSDVDPFESTELDATEGLQNLDMHTQWCRLIMDYTRRGITKTTDRMIALDGIAQAISNRTSNRYVAGLWYNQLLIGLMWRIPWDKNPGFYFWKQAEDSTLNFLSSRHDNHLAPSWSWGSVTFPVEWPFSYDASSSVAGMRPLCDVLDISVQGTPFYQTGAISIRGLTHSLYVDPFYQQYHFSGEGKENPKIGELGILNHGLDSSDSRFICSVSLVPVTDSRDFHFFPMSFSPDEFLDRTQKVTFLALAEFPPLEFPTALETPTMPSILTLALLPTGNKQNEYRRVGLARWHNCSWYGYYCIGDTYDRSHLNELRSQKLFRGWRIALKDLVNKLLCCILGALLNLSLIQQPGGRLRWFMQLASGKYGRHRHDANPKSMQSYRDGWKAKLETINII